MVTHGITFLIFHNSIFTLMSEFKIEMITKKKRSHKTFFFKSYQNSDKDEQY